MTKSAKSSLDPRALLDLGPDWDSYDGVKITEAAVKTAEALRPVPLSDGGIQLELHCAGSDLEIEIGADGKIRGICWDGPR